MDYYGLSFLSYHPLKPSSSLSPSPLRNSNYTFYGPQLSISRPRVDVKPDFEPAIKKSQTSFQKRFLQRFFSPTRKKRQRSISVIESVCLAHSSAKTFLFSWLLSPIAFFCSDNARMIVFGIGMQKRKKRKSLASFS